MPSTPAHHLPRRPLLLPGVRVVRQDDRHLRVGLGPRAVVLPDEPSARALLAASTGGRTLVDWDEPTLRHGHRLAAAGLLMDGDDYAAAQRAGRRAGLTEQLVAGIVTRAAGEAGLRRRLAGSVVLDVPDGWGEPLTALLRAEGLRLAGKGDRPAVRLVGCPTEPRRSTLDPLVRVDEPHLLLRLVEGRVTVGPFVVPGITACLRCVDAHLADRDPRRPVVLEQYADPDCGRSLPDPVSPSLLALGWAAAVQDLVTWVEGDRPSSWSATLEVAEGLALTRTLWTRHPHCGCAWGAVLAAG
ncbi:MAG: hypothetical protein U0R80_05195 [Nocardioidaceae bacterium]